MLTIRDSLLALLVTATGAFAQGAPGPWRIVRDGDTSAVSSAPDGMSFVTGGRPASLWDSLTGMRVTTLPLPCTFDRSGTFLVGVHRCPNDATRILALTVFDRRTGEIVAPSLAIDARLVGALTTEWIAEPFDEKRAREVGHWYGVRRFPLAGGTLRVHLPLAERAIASNVRLDVRTDGRRALLHYDASPRGTGQLIDPAQSLPLASWPCHGRDAVFTEDGSTVFVATDGQLLRIDAERGSVQRVILSLGLDGAPWPDLPLVSTADAVLVATEDRVLEFDIESLALASEVFLDPPLSTSRPEPRLSPTMVIDTRTRVVVFEVEGDISAYDLNRGARLWGRPGARFAGNARVAAGALLVRDGDGTLARLAVRTGALITQTQHGALAVTAVEAFSVRDVDTGAVRDGALVCTADGELRAFALTDGAALGRTELHVGREGVEVALAADGASADVVSWDRDGRVALLGLPALDERARLELGAEARVVAADTKRGRVVVARRVERDDLTEVSLRRIGDGAALARFELADFRRAALSNDGERIALVARGRAIVVELATCAVRYDVELPGARSDAGRGAAALHGDTTLLLGVDGDMFQGGSWVGLQMFDLARAALVAEHQAGAGGVGVFGGWVEEIVSLPQHERVVYVVGSDTWLVALDPADWREVASVDLRNGWGRIEAAPGSTRLLAGGRVLDPRTLSAHTSAAPNDVSCLAETRDGGVVLGLEHGQTVVLAGEPLARRFMRQELAGGGALLLGERGEWTGLDVSEDMLATLHVTRSGASVPLACFMALVDEDGGRSLAALPDPPRIVRGPARIVMCAEEPVSFECEAHDARGVDAVVVRVKGRAPQRLPVAVNGVARVTVPGPWPLDVELAAVSRSGVESRPWRTRFMPRP